MQKGGNHKETKEGDSGSREYKPQRKTKTPPRLHKKKKTKTHTSYSIAERGTYGLHKSTVRCQSCNG